MAEDYDGFGGFGGGGVEDDWVGHVGVRKGSGLEVGVIIFVVVFEQRVMSR